MRPSVLGDGLRVAAHLEIADDVIVLAEAPSGNVAKHGVRVAFPAVQFAGPAHERRGEELEAGDGVAVEDDGDELGVAVDDDRAAAGEALDHAQAVPVRGDDVDEAMGSTGDAEDDGGGGRAVVDDDPVARVDAKERLLQPELAQHVEAPRAHHAHEVRRHREGRHLREPWSIEGGRTRARGARGDPATPRSGRGASPKRCLLVGRSPPLVVATSARRAPLLKNGAPAAYLCTRSQSP